MCTLAPAETKLLHALVTLSGRRAAEFRLKPRSGRVDVFGRRRMASYPANGWTSAVLRHLYQGYFDLTQPLPSMQRPAEDRFP